MLIEIKNRYSGAVLFSYECENNSIAITVRAAIDAKADLYGANLRSADLYGADLYGANLRSADLYGADLYGANLRSANLRSADLRSADLYGADLGGADLYGADLYGADLGEYGKLLSERPVIQLGPIGSRNDYLIAHITEQGIIVRAGCFFGTLEDFLSKLDEEHGDNKYSVEYRAAITAIKAMYASRSAS